MPPGPPIASIGRLIGFNPHIVVPGHGPISVEPLADLQLTRDDLVHLRQAMAMAKAADNLEPFDEAYARADWSRFTHLPLFRVANRMNACNTCLLLEQQGAAADKPSDAAIWFSPVQHKPLQISSPTTQAGCCRPSQGKCPTTMCSDWRAWPIGFLPGAQRRPLRGLHTMRSSRHDW